MVTDFILRISPLVAIFAALFGLLVWWGQRKERRKNHEHAEELAALAARLGGAVTGPAEASAWSARLAPPLKGDSQGLVNRLSTVAKPVFKTALDFRRGPWRVRVSEASMKKSVSNGTSTFYEHRIDVATADLPPLKISRRLATDFLGRSLAANHVLAQGGAPVREAPVTVAQRQGEWAQIMVPEPASAEFVAFTSDPHGAAGMLNPGVLEWIVQQAGHLPLMLTFEAGLLYATMPGRIDTARLLPTVDAMLGLLDRISGAAPMP
jgi:hypothetical protein